MDQILIWSFCLVKKLILVHSFIGVLSSRYLYFRFWLMSWLIDRIFSPECSTKQVYDEGPKKVALSVVNGINSKYYSCSPITASTYLLEYQSTNLSHFHHHNVFSSKYFCIWADKQRKDVHHVWNYWIYNGWYIWLHTQGTWNVPSLVFTWLSLLNFHVLLFYFFFLLIAKW